MKHKKQLRKAQDERKTPADAENSSEGDAATEKSAEELRRGQDADTYVLDEHDDDVDIEEDDMCSPDHLL